MENGSTRTPLLPSAAKAATRSNSRTSTAPSAVGSPAFRSTGLPSGKRSPKRSAISVNRSKPAKLSAFTAGTFSELASAERTDCGPW